MNIIDRALPRSFLAVAKPARCPLSRHASRRPSRHSAGTFANWRRCSAPVAHALGVDPTEAAIGLIDDARDGYRGGGAGAPRKATRSICSNGRRCPRIVRFDARLPFDRPFPLGGPLGALPGSVTEALRPGRTWQASTVSKPFIDEAPGASVPIAGLHQALKRLIVGEGVSVDHLVVHFAGQGSAMNSMRRCSCSLTGIRTLQRQSICAGDHIGPELRRRPTLHFLISLDQPFPLQSR